MAKVFLDGRGKIIGYFTPYGRISLRVNLEVALMMPWESKNGLMLLSDDCSFNANF